MSVMISASDVLQVISETHQYRMLLVELRDATVFGVAHSNGKLNYFKVDGSLTADQRRDLVDSLSAGQWHSTAQHLTVEDFLLEIEGKKAKHIWLESGESKRKELGFVSISELKSYFRTQSHGHK
jgi:hypothetical protein